MLASCHIFAVLNQHTAALQRTHDTYLRKGKIGLQPRSATARQSVVAEPASAAPRRIPETGSAAAVAAAAAHAAEAGVNTAAESVAGFEEAAADCSECYSQADHCTRMGSVGGSLCTENSAVRHVAVVAAVVVAVVVA